MKMDQFLSGAYCALDGARTGWRRPIRALPKLDRGCSTRLDSINTEAVQRSNGLLMISEPFLKDWEGAYLDADGNAHL